MSDVNKQANWFLAVSALIGVFILVAAVAAMPVFNAKAWIGRKQLPVEVLVLDRESLQPVSGADVVLFNGPHSRSRLESRILSYRTSEFSLDDENAEPQQAKTDEDGRVALSRRFMAAGTEGNFVHTGYIDTSDVWVQVSAHNYGSITLPLDGQSARPRDIDDEYPVYVTLLLKRVEDAK